MQSDDLDLQFGPAPEARPQPDQQRNHDATHEPPSLSVHAAKLNCFNADGVYDRHRVKEQQRDVIVSSHESKDSARLIR